jgi:hypothetical protein
MESLLLLFQHRKTPFQCSLCVLDHRQSPQSQLYGYYLKVGMQAVDVEIWGLVKILDAVRGVMEVIEGGK